MNENLISEKEQYQSIVSQNDEMDFSTKAGTFA